MEDSNYQTSLAQNEPEDNSELKRIEVKRLFCLGDRWLAAALLRIVRDWREIFPDKLSQNPGYNSYFVWQVVPEVAKRLGAQKLLIGEASDPLLSNLTNAELRIYVGQHMRCHTLDWLASMGGKQLSIGQEIIYNEIAQGNPVAFALDRIHPALDTSDDWVAKHTVDLCKHWNVEQTPYWTPNMLELIQVSIQENSIKL